MSESGPLGMQEPPIRLLVVESSNTIRTVLSLVLSIDTPIKVVGEAESGAEALAMIPTLKPNLLLTELDLLGMNGLEMLRYTREMVPDIKILVLTANEDEATVLAALALGVQAYCLKGLPINKLVEIIQILQQGKEWIDPAIRPLVQLRPEIEILQQIKSGKRTASLLKTQNMFQKTMQTYIINIWNKLIASRMPQLKGLKEG